MEKANKALKKELENKSDTLAQLQHQQEDLEIKVKTIEDINEKLIDDTKTFNDKMLELVPKTMIQENIDLKETINVLHAVIDVYKQAEIDAEKDSENGEIINHNLDEVADQTIFQCKDCAFISESKRGLSVHTTRKHYPERGQENLKLISF